MGSSLRCSLYIRPSPSIVSTLTLPTLPPPSTLPTCYLPKIPPIQAGLIDQPPSATHIAIQEIDDGVTHRRLPR